MNTEHIIIETSQVRDLIDDQFPQFRGEDIVALETAGTVNAIFRIGATHVARFFLHRADPLEAKAVLESEFRASAEFNAHSPFPSPIPVGIGRLSLAYPMPWLVQTWVDGHPAGPNTLSASSSFTDDVVRLIATLRAVAVNGRRFDGRGRGGNLRDHDDWMATCFAKSDQLLDVAPLRRLWDSLRDLPSHTHEVMSHKDLIPANLLVEGEHLVGVLDTGGFGPADPSLDLVAAWHLLDRANRANLREALRVDNLAWRRGAAWALQQAIGLVWYYKDSNPIMSALGRSTLGRLLEDYGDLIV